jgi:hypothetical protein
MKPRVSLIALIVAGLGGLLFAVGFPLEIANHGTRHWEGLAGVIMVGVGTVAIGAAGLVNNYQIRHGRVLSRR